MRSLRLIASLSLTIALVASNVSTAGAIAFRRIDAVSFSDATHGFVSGGRDPRTGFVSYTENGTTFHTMTMDNRWFYGVEADGLSSGWAASNSQDSVLRSTDGGATWSETGHILTSEGTNVRGLLKLGSRIVAYGQNKAAANGPFYAGDVAFIASSTNGGSTWSSDYQGPVYPAPDEFTDPPTTRAEMISADSADGTSAFMAANEWNAGSGGDLSKITFKRPLFYKTTDGGATWATQTPDPLITAGNAVTGIAAGSSTVAWAGTGNRVMARTTDGVNWIQWRMPRSTSYSPVGNAVDAWDEDTLVVGGTGGFVAWNDNAKLGASDSVADWRYSRIPTGANINAIQALSATSAIAVGDEETIARTDNSGVSWTVLPAGPPVASVTGPGAGFPLTLTPINITGTASDAGLGVEKVEVRIRRADGLSYDGVGGWTATDTWLNTQTSDRWDTWSYSWTPDMALLLSGKMVTIAARATDAAGLSAISTGVSSGAPMSASVSLAGGNPYTTSSPVTASISADGSTHMRWRVNGAAYNAWQPYATSASIALPAGDGVKTVDFQFSTDNGANVAAAASDTITLHTSVPTVAISAPSAGFGMLAPIAISGTASDTGGSVSSVQVRVRRGGDGQCWNGTAWTSADTWLDASTSNGFATWTYNWTPTGVGDQFVTINARATDMATLANTSAGVTSAGPVTASVSLADGANYTATTSVSAAVSASGVTHMRWKVDGGAFNAWQPYASTAAITLPAGDGTKTVNFEFSADGITPAGSASDSIVLHTSLPAVSVAKPSAGFRLSLAPVTVEGSATDVGLNVTGTELLLRRADGYSWDAGAGAWTSGDKWFSVPLTGDSWHYVWTPGSAAIDPGDIVTVFARATDESGLSSTTGGLASGSPIRGNAVLADGDRFTATSTVAASVNATPLAWMRYSVDGGTPSTWEQYASSELVHLTGSDGTKTVSFEFAGEESGTVAAVASDQIFLDTTKPIVAISAPSANFPLSTMPILFEGTAQEISGSGLAGVDLQIKRGTEYWNGAGWQGLEAWVPADVTGNNWSYAWNDIVASAGHLRVTVTARSRDNAGNLSSTHTLSSVDPLDPTSVTLTSVSKTLSYGGTGYVKGTLKLLGEPYSNKSVTLQAGSSTSTFKDVASATTNANGEFSFSVKPASKTYYRVRFAKTTTIDASTSSYIAFTPKAYVTVPYAPSTAKRSVAFASYGYLKPKHSAGSYPVRIYLYRYVNGSYVYYRYVSARASNYSTYTKYSASVKLPYAGKWRIRAYHSDSGHATTTSSYRYVTVR